MIIISKFLLFKTVLIFIFKLKCILSFLYLDFLIKTNTIVDVNIENICLVYELNYKALKWLLLNWLQLKI